jgi:hypothetical protein
MLRSKTNVVVPGEHVGHEHALHALPSWAYPGLWLKSSGHIDWQFFPGTTSVMWVEMNVKCSRDDDQRKRQCRNRHLPQLKHEASASLK